VSGAEHPDIRVVRGDPTPEELAALLTVWAGAGAAGDEPAAPRPRPRQGRTWSRGAGRLADHGPGLWRRDGRSAGWTP
jgi:hypothetical protein